MSKRRPSLTAFALVVVVMVGSTFAVSSAEARDDSANSCVTKHEWRHANIGTQKARVRAVFDTRGRFVDGFAGGYTRRYQPCAWNGGTDVRLYVSYDGLTRRVFEKRVI